MIVVNRSYALRIAGVPPHSAHTAEELYAAKMFR
jgi:hypothetical protein